VAPDSTFLCALGGVLTRVLVRTAALRRWSGGRELSSFALRNLAEHEAEAAIREHGARAGERWAVVLGEHAAAERLDGEPRARRRRGRGPRPAG
jgi:hypothetical protein